MSTPAGPAPTRRDLFAAHAIGHVLGGWELFGSATEFTDADAERIALACFRLADAMVRIGEMTRPAHSPEVA